MASSKKSDDAVPAERPSDVSAIDEAMKSVRDCWRLARFSLEHNDPLDPPARPRPRYVRIASAVPFSKLERSSRVLFGSHAAMSANGLR